MFVNYVNGIVSINTFRKPSATQTTLDDILSAVESESTENLVASVSSADLANPEVLAFINTRADDTLDLPIEF